jgi:hypothetical protein
MVGRRFLYFQVAFFGEGRGGRDLKAALISEYLFSMGKNKIGQSENEYILAWHIS